jgi:hypothetical protein
VGDVLTRDDGGADVIKRYLCELDHALRRQQVSDRRRRRLLAEVEDHLRSDPEAVATFGDPDQLARQVAAAVEQPRRVRWWSIALVGTVFLFVAPLYAIPENALPPAPREGLPESIEWKLDWALALYGAALVLAVLSVAASWTRPRLARWPALLAVGALSGSVGLATAAAAVWPVGGSIAVASVVPVAVVLVFLAAFEAARLASAAWPPRLR